jgi:putative DNA primase/helicase
MTDCTAALDACRSIGLLIDEMVLDGQWHRVPVEGKKRANRSGAYCLRELMLKSGAVVVVGLAHNWTTGAQSVFDIRSQLSAMTDEERAQAKRAMDEARRSAREERARLADEAAARAEKIWSGLPESGASDYLQRKKVRAYGLKFSRGSIVVPVRDMDGRLRGLQFIKPDGGKKFLTGTEKRVHFHVINDMMPQAEQGSADIYIAEGYATGATVHLAMGAVVFVAFDAGNLQPVAEVVRRKYQSARIIIAADNDAATKGNPGLTQAHAAAAAVNGMVVFPTWPVQQQGAA